MAVLGFVLLSPGSPTQCLNHLSYLPTPNINLSSDQYNYCGHYFDSTRLRTQGFEFHDLSKWELNSFSHSILYSILPSNQYLFTGCLPYDNIKFQNTIASQDNFSFNSLIGSIHFNQYYVFAKGFH